METTVVTNTDPSSPDYGKSIAIVSKVPTYNTVHPELNGNTYPAGSVKPGYELNALDIISEFNNVWNDSLPSNSPQGNGIGPGDPFDPRGPWQTPRSAGDVIANGITTGGLLGSSSTISLASGTPTYPASYINGGGGADAGRAANTSSGASTTITGKTTSETTYSSGGKTQTATLVTGGGGADSGQAANPKDDPTATEGRRPILLDLDGDGVKITDFGKSAQFVAGKDGLSHRTSWAGAGEGVLFFDPDGRNAITEERQYVFTEWDPTATGDLEAIRSTFDSNGDGKLTAAECAQLKVLVTHLDAKRWAA